MPLERLLDRLLVDRRGAGALARAGRAGHDADREAGDARGDRRTVARISGPHVIRADDEGRTKKGGYRHTCLAGHFPTPTECPEELEA